MFPYKFHTLCQLYIFYLLATPAISNTFWIKGHFFWSMLQYLFFVGNFIFFPYRLLLWDRFVAKFYYFCQHYIIMLILYSIVFRQMKSLTILSSPKDFFWNVSSCIWWLCRNRILIIFVNFLFHFFLHICTFLIYI